MKSELLFAVFAMISVGVADVLRRRGLMSGSSPVTYMAVETGFMTLFAFVAMLLLEGRPNLTKSIVTYSPVTGFLVFAGILALLMALGGGEASRYSPVARLGFVVTFLLAVFVFGEELTVPKGIGVIMAAGAVFLLSLDS